MADENTFEPFAIVDQFCETLVRIDNLGLAAGWSSPCEILRAVNACEP
ncbi:hypothetical protein [Bradyrhizobium sp. 164]|nr:hypothetical protein [Bradyrhizobium sp. 164]MCK1599838.1 hypothetical protein [Bradyrhizobium sp. 164]